MGASEALGYGCINHLLHPCVHNCRKKSTTSWIPWVWFLNLFALQPTKKWTLMLHYRENHTTSNGKVYIISYNIVSYHNISYLIIPSWCLTAAPLGGQALRSLSSVTSGPKLMTVLIQHLKGKILHQSRVGVQQTGTHTHTHTPSYGIITWRHEGLHGRRLPPSLSRGANWIVW